MSFKIVVDSCCELPEEYLQDSRFEIVPLGLEVGDYQIQDDENFDQAEFLKKVAECPKCPKSACPSPERFREAYHTEAEHVYVITLSSHLSGSYNSAVLGMNLYREKYGKKQIHVIDSESASCGETQIVKKLVELEEQGLSFEEIVKQIEEFRSNVHTYFVLDNLETLLQERQTDRCESTGGIHAEHQADHGRRQGQYRAERPERRHEESTPKNGGDRSGRGRGYEGTFPDDHPLQCS